MEGDNETDDAKSGIRARLLSLESSLEEKELRVSQLEQELSGVQAKCRQYRRECKQLSRELRSRRQDLKECLRGACRPYSPRECCSCRKPKARDQSTQTFATDFCSVESSGSVLDWLPNEGQSVAEVVQEAVASVSSTTDYIYDQASGLYYSTSSGYYYDPVQKLFYEPHSRTYYSYDEKEKTYNFHSQLPDPNEKEIKTKKHKKRSKRGNKTKQSKLPEDLEEGEISPESDKSSSEPSTPNQASDEENPENYPPSMRLIVKKSEKLPTGSLLLVTFQGATVGRTQESGVCLLDNGISRMHAKIEYDSERSSYLVYDLGSQNGTFVNLKRLSEPKVQNEEGCEVQHGDWVTFGTTELIAHVHSGHNTCDECEPGLLLQNQDKHDEHIVLSREEREEQRRDELRRMKKKYAVCDYEPEKPSQNYNNRAEQRRKTVGSSNPYEKDAEPSSVDKPVSEDNAGFRMLQKLGWKKGESLGQGDTGMKEPINAYEDGQIGRAGLGTRSNINELCASGNVQIVIVPSVPKTKS